MEHRAPVDAARGRQLLDRAGRQPPQREPPHALAGQRAEHLPQRVVVAHRVVAVGEQQHAGQLRHPPGEVADDVEGGVVGPVDVLDDQHRGLGGELPVDGAEDRVALRGLHGGVQRAVAAAHHVAERAERAGGHQVVADADEHPDAGPLGERPHQAGLADPGLAGDQHDRAVAPAGLAQALLQQAELGVALEQAPGHAGD